MPSPMRCDGCDALRWYGKPLHRELLVFDGREHMILLCETCSEQRNIALWPEHWEPYLPRMHAPHLSTQ